MTEKTKKLEEMSREERQKYFEGLGVDGKKVEELKKEHGSVTVIEGREEKEKKEKKKKEELEQYRERTGL